MVIRVLELRQRAAALLVAAAACLAPGCDRDQPPNTSRPVVKVSELPGPVRKAAEKAVPGVAFDEAWKNVDAKTKALHSYEIRGRAANGKIREVRVSTGGEILEME